MSKQQDLNLLEFPTEFFIKAMGNAGEPFESTVVCIINKYVKDLNEGAISINPSKNGTYSAMTISFEAESREQLDNIYQELSASEHVIMAL